MTIVDVTNVAVIAVVRGTRGRWNAVRGVVIVEPTCSARTGIARGVTLMISWKSWQRSIKSIYVHSIEAYG